MGALDDLTKKAQGFVEEHKAEFEQALKGEQAEDISDKVFGAIADKADEVTGGKHSEKIAEVKDTLDKKIGTE